MDRVTVAALMVASASVILSLVCEADSELAARHVVALLLPLAVIAFPETMDAGFRRSSRGMAHGGEATPGSVLRIVGLGLLVVFVVLFHFNRFTRIIG